MVYRFGPFVADCTAYAVRRDDRRLDLTPKLLDLLFYLLERPATLVTKEQLLEDVWPVANVTDNALAQAISDLREALGDSPSAPAYVRTVARRGYRFVADIHAVAWLSAGITETVASDLASIAEFCVTDRWRVVHAARRTRGSLRDLGEALGASLLVTGGYQRIGPQLRIRARLVDVALGEALADGILGDSCAAVTAVPDSAKGERLVAFYTRLDVSVESLWEQLCQTELPRLRLPRRDGLFAIEAIPTLGTGKVDVRGLRQLAVERVSTS